MRQALTFTEEQKNTIINYYTNGDSATTIINKLKEQDSNFKCSKPVMNRFIAGLNINRKSKRAATTPVLDYNAVMDMLASNMGYERIAKKLKTTVYFVDRFIEEHHIDNFVIRDYREAKRIKELFDRTKGKFDVDLDLVKFDDKRLKEVVRLINIALGGRAHVEEKWVYNFEGKGVRLDFYCPEVNQAWLLNGGYSEEVNDEVSFSDQCTIINNVNRKCKTHSSFTSQEDMEVGVVDGDNVFPLTLSRGIKTVMYNGFYIHTYYLSVGPERMSDGLFPIDLKATAIKIANNILGLLSKKGIEYEIDEIATSEKEFLSYEETIEINERENLKNRYGEDFVYRMEEEFGKNWNKKLDNL